MSRFFKVPLNQVGKILISSVLWLHAILLI